MVADSTTALDLTDHKPSLPPRTKAGKQLWQKIVAEPPYWWTQADVFMAEHLCTAMDAVARSMQPGKSSDAGRAAVSKEYRMVMAELGLSPTSRGRLKLTEAQGVVAAEKVEAMADERDRRRTEAIDLDEFDDDD